MSKNKLIIKNAFIITLLIGAFFMLSKLVGLADNPALRIFNIAFVFVGVYLAIKENMYQYDDKKYITNFGVGLRTSILSVILSIIGVIVYSKIINPDFFEIISNSVLIGKNLNLFELIFTFAIEGLAISVIASFMMMQYFKKDVLKEMKQQRFDSVES
jgi:hypothetical protein